jgi:hypothetical protein
LALSVLESDLSFYNLSSDDELWLLLTGSLVDTIFFAGVISTGMTGEIAISPEVECNITSGVSHEACASNKASQHNKTPSWLEQFTCLVFLQMLGPNSNASSSCGIKSRSFVCSLRKVICSNCIDSFKVDAAWICFAHFE